ncbi:MAG: cytochrome P450 [Acidimicrobiales bacterium]|nr:cytochrome P450 [Acidimicrobiales bacterium]
MSKAVKAPGIPASFESVDWNPPGLPTDPDEIVGAMIDPATRGELYPHYHQLRRVAPVHRNPPEVFHGAWTFTRFTETDLIFRNPRVVNDPQVVDEAFAHGDGSFTDVMRSVMIWQQPEPHQRVRNLVKSAFTPRAIARWRPIAEQVASELCDRIEAQGGAELVDEYNYELPFNVIAHILGIPEDDFPTIKSLAWDFARAGEKYVTDDVAERGDRAARAFLEYFGELAEARRSAPGDDLLTSLVEAEADGERLTHTELLANCILLLQAGHETTQDLLGNAQVALFRNPEQLAQFRSDPALTKNAVEEFLRYDGSVQINHRVVLDGMRIGDATIDDHAMVYVFLGAVNRDPDRYPDPDRLDLRRDLTHHLAFSFGAYYCIGAALARTEIAVGLRTLIDRFPALRPATDTFEWRNTLQLRGPQRLDVTW